MDTFVDKNMNGALKTSFSSDSLEGREGDCGYLRNGGSPWSCDTVDNADMVLAVGFDDDDMMTVLGVNERRQGQGCDAVRHRRGKPEETGLCLR